MFHSGPVKEEFSQSTYQRLPFWKSWGSKNKSVRYEALVEEVHETDSTEFIKDQTLASSDRNLTGSSTNSKRTTNAFLVSRSLPFKCIFILHRHHAKYCYNPHPPLQIKREIRKGSKQTKLKQNHTHDLIKATETMKTSSRKQKL